MPQNFGVGFVIGASVAASVNSAFNIVSNKIKATTAQLGKARHEASVLSKAITLSQQKEGLEQKVAAGDNSARLQAELAKVTQRYEQARKAALAYGDSVEAWEKAHLKAQTSLRQLTTLKDLQVGRQQESDRRREIRGSMIGSAANLMVVSAPVRSAIAFETAMADAAKTIDGMRDSAGNLTPAYYEMEASVKRLGRSIPLTHEQIASLYAAGGQQGLTATKDLEEFATLSAHMAVAFDMSNEAAAEAIGGYRTAMDLSFEQTRSMLDLMNQYANTSSASEAGIADVVRRIGSLGQVAGISAKPMTAMAATLDSMKVAPEVAATGIKNFLLTLTAGSSATKAQSAAFAKLGIDTVKLAAQMQKDGPAAILSVLEAIKRLPKEEQLSLMAKLFGRESIGAIAPMLANLELVRKNLHIAGDEASYAGAMQREFENRSRTTANNLTLLKNRAGEVGVTLGAAVLPALNSVLATMGPMISAVATFAQENQGLTTGLVGVVAALAIGIPLFRGALYLFSLGRTAVIGYRTAVLLLSNSHRAMAAASYASAAASRVSAMAMGGLRGAAAMGAAGVRLLGGGIRAVGLLIRANPIGLLVTAMLTLYSTCEPVRAAFDAVFGFIGKKIGWVWEKLKSFGSTLKSVASFVGLGGDDEEEEEPSVAAAMPKAVAPAMAAVAPMSGLTAASPAAASLPASMPQQVDVAAMMQGYGGQVPDQAMPAPGVPVSANFQFSLNGISDAGFAERVVRAVQDNRSRFEELLESIVRDQRRAAYGY